MKNLWLALAFLTVFPAVKIESAGISWPAAAVFFPLVGAVLGAFLAAAAVLSQGLMPSPLAAALALAALFLLTRGLHTDGLSDTADGLMGGLDRERSLRIMRSGTAGPMGMATVTLSFLIRFAALISLPGHMPTLLFFTPLCGRWCMVLAGAAFNPAREEGLGSAFIGSLGWRHFLLATLAGSVPVFAGILLLGSYLPVFTGLFLASGVTSVVAAYVARRLGGLTGDTLGAINEIAETTFLLGAVLASGI